MCSSRAMAIILKTTILLSVLVLSLAQMDFTPELELECFLDNSFKVTVNGVDKAFVSVDGFCDTQEATMNGDVLSFNTGTCNNLPEFDETFQIVVKDSELFITNNMAVFNASCSVADNDTLTLGFVSNVTLPDSGSNQVINGAAFPTFVVSVLDEGNAVLTEGAIGTPVQISIRLRDQFTSTFTYQVTGITVYANGKSQPVVKDGCPLFPPLFDDIPVVTDPSQAITIKFELFSIVTDNPPNPTTVTYKVDLFVCQTGNGGCPPPEPVCPTPTGRKRRELAVDSDVSYNLPVVVYSNAADMPPNNNANNNDRNKQDLSQAAEDCESHMPYIWGIIALAIVSLLCVLVMTWLVCRTRGNLRDKSYSESEYHSNGGYKH